MGTKYFVRKMELLLLFCDFYGNIFTFLTFLLKLEKYTM